MTGFQQLLLNLNLPQYTTFANFYVGRNQHLLSVLQHTAPNNPLIYIWGKASVGKTHLLQASCYSACQKTQPAFYLSLRDFSLQSPAILENLEQFSLVCIDDIDQIAGSQTWEEALLHLYEQQRTQGGCMILASSKSPKDTGFLLADLASRFSGGMVFQLHGLVDDEKIAALKLHALNRGFTLPHAVGKFIVERYSRDMATLEAMLNKLAQLSLITKRKLTIPFVKTMLDT